MRNFSISANRLMRCTSDLDQGLQAVSKRPWAGFQPCHSGMQAVPQAAAKGWT